MNLNLMMEKTKVTSDEPDDSPGPGDGSTTTDIVITPGCKSVQLRAERDGTKDGRVYRITLVVRDSSGNLGQSVATVSVPLSSSQVNAYDSGVALTVNGCSP